MIKGESLTIGTHDGTFHTDDVFACAVLSVVFSHKTVHIVRTRDEALINTADIVVDVGGIYDPSRMRFDHHQKGGAGERDNGIPYASIGLVWKEYGVQLAGSVKSAEFIDMQLVQGIDGADNGVVNKVADNGVFSFSVIDMISSMRPTWEESVSLDDAFGEAVILATTILKRSIKHAQAYSHATELLVAAYDAADDKRIIIIGTEYPGWYELMAQYPEPLYVLYQRDDGNWTAKAVRSNPIEFATRKPFPESWGGLRDAELQEVSGVADAIFCHNGRFIAVAKSKEGALKLAQIATLL